MIEMAVNAPKATDAHPIVLRIVDLLSFTIRLLLFPLLQIPLCTTFYLITVKEKYYLFLTVTCTAPVGRNVR
jgi:hypothetical protein